METQKHPESAVDWVAQLCPNWLSPGKPTRFFQWDNTVKKNNFGNVYYFCPVLRPECDLHGSLDVKHLLGI